MKHRSGRLSIEELRSIHARERDAIRERLGEFSRVPVNEYFYELLYCLLTPQSSAVNAGKAVETLRRHTLHAADVDPEPLLHGNEYYIRFHKTKTRHILRMKQQFPEILDRCRSRTEGFSLRFWLVENVHGLGWKEASHFLRNIGYRDLAILDRHILRNLIRTGVLKKLPESLTPKRYLSIERRFGVFATKCGIPMDELDLLFWSMETGEILK